MSAEKRHGLWYNVSYLGILQVSNFILSLLVIPYVIRVVGTEGFGVIAVAQVVIFYLSVTADYGFNRTAIRDIALYKDDSEKVSRVFSTVLVSKLFICLLSFGILLLLVSLVPLFHQHYLLYLMAFSFVLGQAVLMNWLFQGQEKMQYMAIANFISKLFFVLLVFFFIRQKEDAWLYLFFMGLGNILAGLLSIAAAIRIYKLRFIPPNRKEIFYEMKEGWPVTVSNLSMTTIQYIGIFILRIFTNDLVVGLYSIAEKVYFAMKLMLDVFSQAAYPRVCRLLQTGRGAVRRFFQQSYIPFLALVVAGTSGIFIFSPAVIRFLSGEINPYPVFLLRSLCIAVIIVCLSIPAALILLAGDHKKNYLRIYTSGMLVCLVTNGVFAWLWEAKGTVLAVLLTEFFITAGLYAEVFRLYKTRESVSPGKKGIAV